MAKHRRILTEPKKWVATTKKGRTRRVPSRDVMGNIFGGFGGRRSVATAQTETFGRHRTGGRTAVTAYTRGAASVGGKIVNARVKSVYSSRDARYHQKSFQVMSPGWRMGR